VGKALLSAFTFTIASASEWNASFNHLGALTEDGTLYESIKLGEIVLGDDIEPITLEHMLFVGLDGSASSTWVVPQLETWLLPTGEGMLLHAPGGWCALYTCPLVPGFGFRPGRSGNDPKVRRIDDRLIEFLFDSDNIYSFIDGSLHSIRQPDGGVFFIKTIGGHITSIAAANRTKLLEVGYDRSGRLDNLTIGGRSLRFLYAKNTRSLLRVEEGGMPLIGFHYKASLISELDVVSSAPVKFTWTMNGDYRPKQIRHYLNNPVALASVNEVKYMFKYDVVHGRTVMQRRQSGGGTEEMIIDWSTGLITTK